jgi:hypothetical protein
MHFVGSVTLDVLDSLVNITERNAGEDSVVSFCFRSSIAEPLTRNVVFGLLESNETTSTSGAEFYPNISVADVVIPLGFSGEFSQCIDIVIIGDNIVEEDEVITYDVMSLSGRDVVRFPQNSSSIVINVQDNDGE